MSTCSKFERPTGSYSRTEFYDFRTDNFLRVEKCDDLVTVRAMREPVPEQEKNLFIRRLALEGFLPEDCQGTKSAGRSSLTHIQWLIDASWVTLEHRAARLVSRYFRPLLASAGLILLIGALGFSVMRGIDHLGLSVERNMAVHAAR